MTQSFLEAITHRQALVDRVALALDHMPRTKAIQLLASWIPRRDLEAWIDTVCGPEKPDPDPDKRTLMRAVEVTRDMGIEVRITKTRVTPINQDKNSTTLFLHFIKEMGDV